MMRRRYRQQHPPLRMPKDLNVEWNGPDDSETPKQELAYHSFDSITPRVMFFGTNERQPSCGTTTLNTCSALLVGAHVFVKNATKRRASGLYSRLFRDLRLIPSFGNKPHPLGRAGFMI